MICFQSGPIVYRLGRKLLKLQSRVRFPVGSHFLQKASACPGFFVKKVLGIERRSERRRASRGCEIFQQKNTRSRFPVGSQIFVAIFCNIFSAILGGVQNFWSGAIIE